MGDTFCWQITHLLHVLKWNYWIRCTSEKKNKWKKQKLLKQKEKWFNIEMHKNIKQTSIDKRREGWRKGTEIPNWLQITNPYEKKKPLQNILVEEKEEIAISQNVADTANTIMK